MPLQGSRRETDLQGTIFSKRRRFGGRSTSRLENLMQVFPAGRPVKPDFRRFIRDGR